VNRSTQVSFLFVPLLIQLPFHFPLFGVSEDKEKGKEKPQGCRAGDEGNPAEPHPQIPLPLLL